MRGAIHTPAPVFSYTYTRWKRECIGMVTGVFGTGTVGYETRQTGADAHY